MAGLYVHVPFCASRCIYCGFYSTTRLEQRQRYVDALCREMDAIDATDTIATIYLGGGTPSQLTPRQLEQLFAYIYNRYAVADDAEVTLECNPDDVTDELATALSQLPVNRVSMGAQTFSDRRLRFLRRRHSSRQVVEAVERLRRAGIRNISIDLMYGFPGETLADWHEDVTAALSLGVEHLSAYCLMVEEGTMLEQWIMDNGQWTMDEELERRMYEQLMDRLDKAGFEHYEISNWSRSGFRSRHNAAYWHDVPYIGIGAAAHSYDGRRRSWNVADLQEYLRRTEQGLSPTEDSEPIEGWTRYNDRLTVALRTCEGLDLADLTAEQRSYCTQNARRFLDDGLLKLESDYLLLTRRGLFVSDMVMAQLMRV